VELGELHVVHLHVGLVLRMRCCLKVIAFPFLHVSYHARP
jgi:hypothetical protein